MAKWAQPSDETHKLIMDVLVTNGLENHIDTKIIVNDEQTKVITVKKETPASKFAYGYDLQITVNESILDELPTKQQLLVIHEALSGTHFDSENDRLVVTAPDKVYRGFIDQHGWDEYEVLIESIKTLYDAKKNKSNEEGTTNE